MPTLISALRDANSGVRRTAAFALGWVKPPDPEAVPALITALGDADAPVREAAAGVLRVIGQGAVPSLVTALSAGDPRIRQGAVEALGWIGQAGSRSAVMPSLIAALGDPNQEVRRRGTFALSVRILIV